MHPLLSICIPTCNRADFLEIMLAALMPQVAAAGDLVEVWVLDNASTDRTPQVVDGAKRIGPLRSYRQQQNRGLVENVTHGPSQLATGVYAWVIGDHNLMRKGALERVIDALQSNTNLDVFYANFRCADYPAQWPKDAFGGFDGAFSYVSKPHMADGTAAHWMDLVEGNSALCTQLYAHIVKTAIWQSYWNGRAIPQPFTSGLTSYPHTWMLVETLFHSPVGCIAEPVVTIFNGAQSWGNPETRASVYFRGLPDLIQRFEKQGLRRDQLRQARRFNAQQARQVVIEVMRRDGANPWSDAWRYLRMVLLRDSYLLKPIIDGFFASGVTRTAKLGLASVRAFEKATCHYNNVYSYLFHRCRPARWWRTRRS